MKETAAKTTTTEQKAKPQKSSQIGGLALAVQFMDMSLRVAVPIVVFSLLGIHLDNSHHTKPLFTLVGFLLSLLVSGYLVYRQVSVAYPDFFKGGKSS